MKLVNIPIIDYFCCGDRLSLRMSGSRDGLNMQDIYSLDIMGGEICMTKVEQGVP